MNLKEAIIIINNLDVSGLKRKLRPKHSLIQVNRKGDIEGIYKYKEAPTEEQQIEALNKHPGTIQIPAIENSRLNEQELKNSILKSMWLFDKMK
jgi:hypothetical protein